MAKLTPEQILSAVSWIRNRSQVPVEKRDAAIRFSIAKALAYDAPIPTSKPDSVKGFFLSNIEAAMDSILSEINEGLVLDYNATKGLAYELWRARVELVYNPSASNDIVLFNALNTDQLSAEDREWVGNFELQETVCKLCKLLEERS